jgi:hypothetical protein
MVVKHVIKRDEGSSKYPATFRSFAKGRFQYSDVLVERASAAAAAVVSRTSSLFLKRHFWHFDILMGRGPDIVAVSRALLR